MSEKKLPEPPEPYGSMMEAAAAHVAEAAETAFDICRELGLDRLELSVDNLQIVITESEPDEELLPDTEK